LVSKYQKSVPGVGKYNSPAEKNKTGGVIGKAIKSTSPIKEKSTLLTEKFETEGFEMLYE
jgi:hypothetical protein